MFVSFEFEHGGGVHRSFQRGTVTVEIDSPEPGDGCKLGGKPPGVGVAADVESGRGYFCHRVVLTVLGRTCVYEVLFDPRPAHSDSYGGVFAEVFSDVSTETLER